MTETTYDALSRPVTKSITTGGKVKTTTYTYDANSNPLTTTNWLGNTSELIYDALNRVVGKRDAHGKTVETLEYDLNNAQISSVDALG